LEDSQSTIINHQSKGNQQSSIINNQKARQPAVPDFIWFFWLSGFQKRYIELTLI